VLRSALPILLLAGACLGGGGAEKLSASPRLIVSYILTTVNSATTEFAGIREFVCDTERESIQNPPGTPPTVGPPGISPQEQRRIRRDLVGLCQKAERVHQHLHYAQLQLTRLLGDAPDYPGVIIPGGGR
jgi:hypothetical protein